MKNALIAGLEGTQNKTARTGNGAVSNVSTLNYNLDFFGAGGALRQADDNRVIDLFSKAFSEDRLLAVKTLFYFRDIRSGQGERKTFRTAILWLAGFYPDVLKKNLELVSEYGRWDDLFVLKNTPLWTDVVQLIDKQLVKDRTALRKEGRVSLLAKWMPSINTSSASTRALANEFATEFGLSPRDYRKTLSALRKYIDVIERKMSSKNFSEIDYSRVPSRAGMIYRKAFSKRDADRYVAFLQAVEKGDVKINAATLYPYDIVRNVLTSGRTADQTLNLQWNALPNYIKEPKNALVIADVSGSMTSVGHGMVRPIDVSISLAIYLAERNKGHFHNYFMTFSNKPTLQRILGSTIQEKVHNLSRAHWEQNTNLQAAFDEILKVAQSNRLEQSELPESLIVISDMQFDVATGGYSYGRTTEKTNFEVIKRKFKDAGYKMPNLVFWNVNAAGNSQFPITIDDNGTAIVSGASPVILTSVLNNQVITPLDVFKRTIEVPRYDAIKV